MKYDCGPLIRAIDAYISKADDDLEGALEDAGFIDAKETVDEITVMEALVAATLVDETKYIMGAVDGAADLDSFASDIWPTLKAKDNLAEKLDLIFYDEFTAFMSKIVNNYVAQIDSGLVVTEITKRTAAMVEGWSKDLSDHIKLSGHDEIERLLAQGLEERQSIAQFARAIMDSHIRDEYYRARTVALTETLRIHSMAQDEALRQNPAVAEKEWVHTGSHKNEPRPNHVEMNGQRVLVDDPFVLNGVKGETLYPMYPRAADLPPEESINCHCIHRGVPSEEILGLPLEERQRLQAEAIAADDGKWEKELDARNRAKAGIE